VLCEVPSGALADIIGRRNLLVAAGILMVIEIGLLCVAPRGSGPLLFPVFLMNRILSGMAEAAASGADEALAYDALQREGRAADWGRVLERQIRYQSIGYVFAMSIGAAVYDPALVNRVLAALGIALRISPAAALRLPLFLTLVMAVAALIQTLGMHETPPAGPRVEENRGPRSRWHTIRYAFRITLRTGRWILDTPTALCVILAGMLFDHVIRVVITLNSQYLRAIHFPDASFGLIGSGLALMGVFMPKIAEKMDARFRPTVNFFVISAMAVAGLTGIAFFWPYFGLMPLALLYGVMMLTQFFSSRYLNQVAASEQRATVLSFKGLSYNLAYGAAGLLYALLLAALRETAPPTGIAGRQALEDVVFRQSFLWLPGYFLLMLAVLIWFAWRRLDDRPLGTPQQKHTS
jgi:MFS family permease